MLLYGGVFCCVNFEKELGNGTVGVTGRLSQSFSVIAPLLTLWMIGGSRKSANKKTEKIHLSVKCHSEQL